MPQFYRPLLSSHGSASLRGGAGPEGVFDSVQLDEEIKSSTPNREPTPYPEFAHLRANTTSTSMDSKSKSHTKGGSFRSHPIFSPNSASSKTLYGTSTIASMEDIDEQEAAVHSRKASSPTPNTSIPEPYASAEPFLSTPINAIIRVCYSQQGKVRELKSANKTPSIISSAPTPEIPLRSYKRLIANGKQIGELFDQWGSTPRLQTFDQHFEVTEWIQKLKEKAEVTRDSIQNPPSSEQVRV